MRVLLDVDGVLADWMTPVLDAIEQVSGRRISIEECQGWLRLNKLGLSKTEVEFVEHTINSLGFAAQLPVLPGAPDGVVALHKLGCEIVYVTSPWVSSETWEYDRRTWLIANRFFGKLVSTADKQLVRGDIFVDDNLANVVVWQDANPDKEAYLWTTEWNRNQEYKSRLAGWRQLAAVVENAKSRQWKDLLTLKPTVPPSSRKT